MSSPADHTPLKKPPKTPTIPLPSSSVIVVSPINQVLLLHRVRTSSSFASAHVFPGGGLSAEHDGEIPAPDSPLRHQDGRSYRTAAIRETFEESGILLAKSKKTGQLFTHVSDEEREQARRDVHGGRLAFGEVLERWGAEADVDGLIPLTRWITPPNVPKRFSTQMYLYFLPLSASTSPSAQQNVLSAPKAAESQSPPNLQVEEDEIVIPNPTSDGGIEHTAARFLPPHKWLSLARANRIILFPPQFFLLSLVAPYLSPTVTSLSSPIPSPTELESERSSLMTYLNAKREFKGEEEISFAEACISPIVVAGQYGESKGEGFSVLKLDRPGPEVEKQGQGRKGIKGWVVTTRFRKDGPRDVDVARTEDVMGKGRQKEKL